jgi:hypothetical protein
MYAWVVLPVVSFTRATLRFPEFGFLGLPMKIWEMTPLRWGEPSRRGDLICLRFFFMGLRRRDWLSVRARGTDAWKERARRDVDGVGYAAGDDRRATRERALVAGAR